MDDTDQFADTDLLMRCMLLAFEYYPMHAGDGSTGAVPTKPTNLTNGSPHEQSINSTTDFTRAASLSATGHLPYTTAILGEDVGIHPSFAATENAHDFLADCMRPTQTRPYDMAWELKALWTVLFGIMLLVAIVGNCIVIWIVLAHREMRTITNYFLLNLSVADLLMSSLNGTFNFVSMLNADWPFGALYCSVNNFMAYATVATSVFTLVAISFDRYVAIVRPLHRRNSRKKVRCFLTAIWLLSAALSAPGLMYSATEAKRYHSGRTRTVCFLLWPDGRYPFSATDYAYNIVFLVLTYGVPMLVMVVCYTLMGRELWGSQSIGEHTQRQHESVRAKKKVVRMFIAVVAIFGICWLPYHMFYVYAYHWPAITSAPLVPHLYLGFYWLAMANSMVNPIIYYWMNRKFRHYFQAAMLCRWLYGGIGAAAADAVTVKGVGKSPEILYMQQLQAQQQQLQQQHHSLSGATEVRRKLLSFTRRSTTHSLKQTTELNNPSTKL